MQEGEQPHGGFNSMAVLCQAPSDLIGAAHIESYLSPCEVLWACILWGIRGATDEADHASSDVRDRRQRPDQEFVELAGFEPAAPSLQTMRSKCCDQGERAPTRAWWGGCGPSEVR
jgi:hypothetical protein